MADWLLKNSEMLYNCMSTTARQRAGLKRDPVTMVPKRFYTLMAESVNHMLKAKRQYSPGGWSNTISAVQEIAEQQTHRCYQAISGISTDYVVPSYCTIPNFFKSGAEKRKQSLHKVCTFSC